MTDSIATRLYAVLNLSEGNTMPKSVIGIFSFRFLAQSNIPIMVSSFLFYVG